MRRTPYIIVVIGANGAGKTRFTAPHCGRPESTVAVPAGRTGGIIKPLPAPNANGAIVAGIAPWHQSAADQFRRGDSTELGSAFAQLLHDEMSNLMAYKM